MERTVEKIDVASALITPIGSSGNINYPAFVDLLSYNYREGVNGFVVAGCTGQGALLTPDEKVKLAAMARDYLAQQALGNWSVIPATGCPSTAATIELTKQMEGIGIDTVLVLSPAIVKPTQGGLVKHYETTAKSVGVDIIMYSVPSRTGGVGIMPETAEELASIDNIVGIKEASGDLNRIKETIERTKGKDFYVFSGDDKYTVDIIELGGVGVISVASNVAPGLVVNTVRDALNRHFRKARKSEEQLKPLYEVLFDEPSPMPAHYALKKMGFEAGIPRLPLCDVQLGTKRKITNVLKGLGFI